MSLLELALGGDTIGWVYFIIITVQVMLHRILLSSADDAVQMILM